MFSYWFDSFGDVIATSRTAANLDDLTFSELERTAERELVAVGIPDDGSCPACTMGDVFVWCGDFTHVSCDCCDYKERLLTPEQAAELDGEGETFSWDDFRAELAEMAQPDLLDDLEGLKTLSRAKEWGAL